MVSTEKPRGVIVLYNVSSSLIKGDPRDLIADQAVVSCAHAVAGALTAAGYQVLNLPLSGDVEQALAPYPPTEWVVFNLAEGLGGRLFEEVRIAWALEAMGYCFTGADGEALSRTTHKARAKALLAAAGVPTPVWWLFRHPDEVDERHNDLPYPLIVKPVAEDGSIGISADSVAHNARGLRERVAYVVEVHRQAALAGVYIVGREFNVALWGDPPQALPLAEIDFSAFSDPYACIVSFAAKWDEGSFEYRNTPAICPAQVTADLARRIRAVAEKAWWATGCQGYARVDVRLGEDGVPYVVEVNCNPDISPDAGFYRAALAGGYSYEQMVVNILQTAARVNNAFDRVRAQGRRTRHPRRDATGRHLHSSGAGVRQGALDRVPG